VNRTPWRVSLKMTSNQHYVRDVEAIDDLPALCAVLWQWREAHKEAKLDGLVIEFVRPVSRESRS
jgi:hypothetical protein